MLLLCMRLCCLWKLLMLGMLCWVVVMALLSIVERLRLLSTLPLTLLLMLLLGVMRRHSAHSIVYECAQVASVCIVSQFVDQLVGLRLRSRLYLRDEVSRIVALGLECLVTATQG
jgi:hypothetical protein